MVHQRHYRQPLSGNVAALARLNDEIDGLNWAKNIPITAISADAERELIRRVFADVEKESGVRLTYEFLADEGAIWNGDFPTDDVRTSSP